MDDDNDLIICFYCGEAYPADEMEDTHAEPACYGCAEATADLLGYGNF